MSDNAYTVQTFEPSEALKRLDRLVGTWNVTGGANGTVRYEWMEGKFFLLQHVDFDHDGHHIKGMEVIGHERPFGATEPSKDIKTRFYDSEGNTFDYVYEIEGDTFTIWAGGRDSGAYFQGTFSADGNTVTGGWTYPGGGGYQSRMTRVKVG
jgi:hypothetical protein